MYEGGYYFAPDAWGFGSSIYDSIKDDCDESLDEEELEYRECGEEDWW